ncbi:MAG: ATP-binding protein, partial [Chlorobiaceae bacterium]|nr:ATP-binding protein [Chlorobiaceae bacterium]
VGIYADPVRSREAILLAGIFEYFWRKNENLDLAGLIGSIQKPPMRQVGVFDVDTFFPEKERFGLAMSFNTIIASPTFQSWLTGEPLDVDRMLHTREGKPRHSIFYLAHLSDSERMFFVTLLLENVLTWMRAQTGTSSLRALLYFDEVFGFLPPVAEPSSKRPLLTLLKQARASGLGCVLVTQNPVDLDYKGLTNTGTWFIGKLQAERDKDRVLEGLKSAIAEAGGENGRVDYDALISQLGNRVFLMHNVHEDRPVVFQTRWAMSYLCGPMQRPQIRKLMESRKKNAAEPAENALEVLIQSAPASSTVSGSTLSEGFSMKPPSLEPSVKQIFLQLYKSLFSTDQYGQKDL